MKMMLLSVCADETRLAIVERGRLVDLAVEKQDSPHLLKRIYKGRVVNIVPALDAAFVDIGIGVNAYLPLLGGRVTDIKGRKVTVGATVLAQVSKEARGSKGPMLTSKLSLAGRYGVLLGQADYIGVSKKIADPDLRDRLRATAREAQAGAHDHGYILRTAAADAVPAELYNDLAFLKRTWESIGNRAALASAPLCLYREADLVLRAVRDYLDDEVTAIRTDDAVVYERICDWLADESIEVTCEPGSDLFAMYHLEEEIRPLLQRRVDLPSGAYLVLDSTEALTAIDVNSGTYRAGHDRNELARRVNQEAVPEIARQLRLRNIGGMILVDFIDMQSEADKSALMQYLRQAVATDRVRTTVVDMTALGLVEMTRRKTGDALMQTYGEPCIACGGTGRVRTVASIAAAAVARLESLQRTKRSSSPIDIEVHRDVYDYACTRYPEVGLRHRFARTIRWKRHGQENRDLVLFLAGEE